MKKYPSGGTLLALACLALTGCVGDGDSYDAASHRLTISAVRFASGTTVFTDVVVDIGQARIISSAPAYGQDRIDSFNPATRRLSIPSVRVGGQTFTNVLLELGADFRVVSAGGVVATGAAAPLGVLPSSYEQKIAAAQAIGPQVLPSEVQAGNAVGFADFFQDGGWSMVTHSLEYDPQDARTAGKLGQVRFYRAEGGRWVDRSAAVLPASAGCLHPRKAVVADFNGDGKPDVFFACHGFDADPFPGEQPYLLLSRPDGSYRGDRVAITGFIHSASAADIDGDGYPDLLITGSKSAGMPSFLINNRDGTFREDATRLPQALRSQPYFSSELVKYFGSNRYDVFLAGHENDGAQATARFIANDGSGTFVGTQEALMPPPAGFGFATDMVLTPAAVYLARTSDARATFYGAAALQKVNRSSLQGELLYQHVGAYPRAQNWAWTTSWINWIIPFNGTVTPLDSGYGISVPQ